jgi:hypothetical protein
MKEKDILVDYQAHQVVIYAEKSDESIGPVQTGAYVTKNYIDEFFHIMGNLEKSLYEKLLNHEISPVYVFMTLEALTVSELASRVRLSKRKVMKHLTYKHFPNIRISELKKYAEVFNIPLANFFQIVSTKQDVKWRMGYNADQENAKPLTISQEKTNNPYIIYTKPEKNQL